MRPYKNRYYLKLALTKTNAIWKSPLQNPYKNCDYMKGAITQTLQTLVLFECRSQTNVAKTYIIWKSPLQKQILFESRPYKNWYCFKLALTKNHYYLKVAFTKPLQAREGDGRAGRLRRSRRPPRRYLHTRPGAWPQRWRMSGGGGEGACRGLSGVI